MRSSATAGDSIAPEVVQKMSSIYPEVVEDQFYHHGNISRYPARAPYKEPPLLDRPKRINTLCHSFTKGLLLGLLIATIVVSAILGGVLGSQLGSVSSQLPISTSCHFPSSNSSLASNVSTTLFNDYQPADKSRVATLRHNCSDSGVLTNSWGDTFIPACGRDVLLQSESAQGGRLTDLMGIVAYSLTDCLDACTSTNAEAGVWNRPQVYRCRAIAFRWDMSNITARNSLKANCWLKNGTLAKATDAVLNPLVISASLTDAS